MSTAANEYKLSLPTAILININIMLGAGIFINTSELAKQAGVLGSINYLIVACLMLPLILCIAQLLRLHPAGGFYSFAQQEMSAWAGFLSGWSYFTSKLASSMVMTHVSVTLLQALFPTSLGTLNTFMLDTAIIILFVGLNMLNIKAGSTIQKMFIGFKTIPIFFAIFAGLYLLSGSNFTAANLIWEGIPTSLPLVIYAVIGFEAACSVSSKIKNAERNAPLAVLISFAIVVCIAFLYQLMFYGALGNYLSTVDYRGVFPALLHKLLPTQSLLAGKIEGLLHVAIASSTLGAAYGIIFSNCWNLHILAQNNHIWFSRLFARLNYHLIPFACVMTEGLLCLLYLLVSQGKTIPLQQIGALGCVIAYAFSVVSLIYAQQRTTLKLARWIPWLGLVSCSILFAACIRSFFLNGMSSLLIYSVLIMLGAVMYFTSKNK